MLGTWQATRPASSLTDSSPTASDSSTHNRFGSARARPTTAVRSYSDSRFSARVERAESSIATWLLCHDLRNLASRPMEPMAACMLPPMLDPDAGTSGPPYLPFAAYAPPSRLAAPAPSWTRAYELPSARKVVSAGLQLALGSNVAIRRASIYIGLLSLGAFGPAAILLLIGLARLLNDPATARTLTGDDPTLIFFEQPELAGPLSVLYVGGIVRIIRLLALRFHAERLSTSHPRLRVS